jgi:hypothetical protein
MNNAFSDFRNGDEFEADLTEREIQQQLLREADATVRWLEEMAADLFLHGDEVDAAIAALLDRRSALAESCAAAEAAEEEWLQAMADRADSERELFERCRRLLHEVRTVAPAAPEIRALADVVEEWQQHMPLGN